MLSPDNNDVDVPFPLGNLDTYPQTRLRCILRHFLKRPSELDDPERFVRRLQDLLRALDSVNGPGRTDFWDERVLINQNRSRYNVCNCWETLGAVFQGLKLDRIDAPDDDESTHTDTDGVPRLRLGTFETDAAHLPRHELKVVQAIFGSDVTSLSFILRCAQQDEPDGLSCPLSTNRVHMMDARCEAQRLILEFEGIRTELVALWRTSISSRCAR